MSISVLILTLNEAVNLPQCLDSVAWSDDIVVFDSFSTDETVAIAKAAGARVVQRKFDNYASQRNAALTEVEYRHPWVLMVDADERWPRSMYREMQQAIVDAQNVSLYHFRRKDICLGRWLKHSLASATWSGRLARLGRVSVKRGVNEEYCTDDEKGYLKGRFFHYPFGKGIAFWVERHNRYSSMEAALLISEARGRWQIRDVFSSDPTRRRKRLKQLAYKVPFRPFLVFCYFYIFRLGFLDGAPGLTYCRLRSMYEYMIDVKVKELRRREQELPV